MSNKMKTDLVHDAINLAESVLDAETFDHSMWIMKRFKDDDHKLVSALHDVVEDTDITLVDLQNKGFSGKVIDAVASITRWKNEDYFDYIDRVSKNDLSKDVKIEDLGHNLYYRGTCPKRLVGRYIKAMNILLEGEE